jgi:hypothetical protein
VGKCVTIVQPTLVFATSLRRLTVNLSLAPHTNPELLYPLNPTNNCNAMASCHPNDAAFLPTPAIANQSLGSILPVCDAPGLTERTSQALNRARAVEFAASIHGGAATRVEVVCHRQILAVVWRHNRR